MTSLPVVQYASRTDVGMRRSANQDQPAVRLCSNNEEWSRCGHLFLVADGMGGHAVGDLASRITADTVPHAYFKCEAGSIQDRVRSAILAANKAINDRARENPEFEGMGTTCSVLSLSEQGAVIGHVGDSRIYRVRQNRIEQLTFDHSLQWEMIRLGRATAENVELFHPRNVITRCLGPDPFVQIDIEGPFSVDSGDYFVLCSDGLSNHVTDSEIGQIVASLPPAESSRLLINLANCRGGSDNSTVVVVGIDGYPGSAAPTPETEQDKSPRLDTTVDIPDRRQPDFWKVVLACASVLCLIAGFAMGLAGSKSAAAVLLVAAVLAWLISRRFGKPNAADAQITESDDSSFQLGSADSVSSALAALNRGQQDLSSSHRAAFLPRSPYRVIEAQLSESLLSHLNEVQSELVQAAKDSGWKVDFNELTNLSRQAALDQQGGKLDRAMKSRAKAIDLLMRELYHRSRSGLGTTK
jgi:protein phosphatase